MKSLFAGLAAVAPKCANCGLDFAAFNIEFIHGPKQLTDIYLLALTVKNGGRLISFDRKIPLSAVHSAKPEHLMVI